jgi:small redox-active disulfide protein 2
MKDIKVLGPGCPKCRKLAKNTSAAADELGLACNVEKVTDITEIVGYGVMTTPALVVDGQVKSVGKALSVDEVKALLAKEDA